MTIPLRVVHHAPFMLSPSQRPRPHIHLFRPVLALMCHHRIHIRRPIRDHGTKVAVYRHRLHIFNMLCRNLHAQPIPCGPHNLLAIRHWIPLPVTHLNIPIILAIGLIKTGLQETTIRIR